MRLLETPLETNSGYATAQSYFDAFVRDIQCPNSSGKYHGELTNYFCYKLEVRINIVPREARQCDAAYKRE